MGYTNEGVVFARWWFLPDAAFRALLYMAYRADDNDNPPQFWEGREVLARVCGRNIPDEPARGDNSTRALGIRKTRDRDFQVVKRAIRELQRLGVVSVERDAAPGYPAVYNLHLNAPTGVAERPQRGSFSDPMGVAERPNGGRSATPMQGASLIAPRRGAITGGTLRTEGTEEREREHEYSPKVPISSAISTTGYPQIPDFDAARTLLESFPDFGESWLSRPEVKRFTGTENRYIAAAELALNEMRRLPGTGTGAS